MVRITLSTDENALYNWMQADSPLSTSTFFQRNVKVSAHPNLNSSRGVVRCPNVSDTSLGLVKKQMVLQWVTDVQRITWLLITTDRAKAVPLSSPLFMYVLRVFLMS